MLYLLFIVTIILFLSTYYICNRDILAPSVLCCIMYIISIMFAVLNIKNWGIDYQTKTFGIMVTAIIAFIIPSLLFYIRPSMAKSKRNDNTSLTAIVCDNKILIICLIIDILITAYYFKEVNRISILGGNNMGVAGMFSYYRFYTANNADAETLSTLANQMLKLGRSFGFVALFIFMYNNQIDKNMKRDKLLIPFIILAALQNIIGGGRGYILWLVCFGFTTAYIVNMKKYSWKKSLAFKYIKIGAIALIVVFIAFYLLKYLVRVGNTVNSILDYIGYYAGGSVQNFNLYIQDPPASSKTIWGQESFMGIYSTLEKFKLVDLSGVYLTNSNLEFRQSNGVAIGNVYGAIRRYYNDFGIGGVIVLQMIASTFFNTFYYCLKKASNNHSKFIYLFYAYLFYHVYELPIDDTFFKNFISFNMITTFIVLYFVYYIFTNLKITTRLRIICRIKNRT